MLPTVSWDALQTDLLIFLPEALLCAAVVALLLVRLVAAFDRTHLGLLSLGALVLCGVVAFQSDADGAICFGGFVVGDAYTRYARLIILGAAGLTVILSLITGIPDREDSGDFYVL